MALRLNPDGRLREHVEQFIQGGMYAIELADDGIDVEIKEKESCTKKKLYAGGKITCALALQLAQANAIPPAQVGQLLNYLNIKVKVCSLGCF